MNFVAGRINRLSFISSNLIGILLCVLIIPCWAKTPEFHLELSQHLFYPTNIEIPAGQKVKLVILNKDDTPEEFDSFDLNREKVLFAHRRTIIFIGPLEPGEYHFFGEYNPNLAIGKVTVKGAK